MGSTDVYLRRVFTDLSKAQTAEDLETLLPGAIKPDQIVMVLSVSPPKTNARTAS